MRLSLLAQLGFLILLFQLCGSVSAVGKTAADNSVDAQTLEMIALPAMFIESHASLHAALTTMAENQFINQEELANVESFFRSQSVDLNQQVTRSTLGTNTVSWEDVSISSGKNGMLKTSQGIVLKFSKNDSFDQNVKATFLALQSHAAKSSAIELLVSPAFASGSNASAASASVSIAAHFKLTKQQEELKLEGCGAADLLLGPANKFAQFLDDLVSKGKLGCENHGRGPGYVFNRGSAPSRYPMDPFYFRGEEGRKRLVNACGELFAVQHEISSGTRDTVPISNVVMQEAWGDKPLPPCSADVIFEAERKFRDYLKHNHLKAPAVRSGSENKLPKTQPPSISR